MSKWFGYACVFSVVILNILEDWHDICNHSLQDCPRDTGLILCRSTNEVILKYMRVKSESRTMCIIICIYLYIYLFYFIYSAIHSLLSVAEYRHGLLRGRPWTSEDQLQLLAECILISNPSEKQCTHTHLHTHTHPNTTHTHAWNKVTCRNICNNTYHKICKKVYCALFYGNIISLSGFIFLRKPIKCLALNACWQFYANGRTKLRCNT